MPSIITIQIGLSPFNNKANLYGNLTRDGWTVVKRGFKYGATTPPTIDKYNSIDADGEYYLTTASNLIAYTLYYYKAYADLKFWEVNEEWPEGHWLYQTVNGDILFFYTNAIANVLTIIAVNATKTGGNENIEFLGYLEDNADDKVSARGFKYGLTEADTWSISEASGVEGSFNRTATGIAGDVDIYFRAFATTPTGDYFGVYEKASTKIFNPVIFMLAQDLWNYLFYLIAYSQYGNIYNAWELAGDYGSANSICVDNDGNTYSIMNGVTLIKRTKDGAVWATKTLTGEAYSIAFHPDGYLCIRGRNGSTQYLQKRNATTLNTIGAGLGLTPSTNPYAYAGLAIDNYGYYYIINLLEGLLEKWDWSEGDKIAEVDLSSVYVGNFNHLSIADDLIYSNEYGEQGWTISTTLLEAPTNWTPQNDYIKSLSSLGENKFILSGVIGDLQGISCYNSAKEFLWENTSYYEMDYYSITGMRNFEAKLLNIKAEKSAGHLYLYGEITEIVIPVIERGFEYLIQDNEPLEEDTGTEVKEIGEFGIGEYSLYSLDTYEDLYKAEENKIWWFRAYCIDTGNNKSIAESWMKNIPTMTTFECSEILAQSAKANGEMTDKGANIVTYRGFRIIKEYEGDLNGASAYIFDGFKGEVEMESVFNNNGILIGFTWKGILYRDSLDEDEEGFELGVYEKILGGGMGFEGFGLYLKPNDSYKIVAIAENQLGIGFGEEVDLVTGQMILPSDDEIVGDREAEKTITLGVIPEGTVVTRIGIRLGRTTGCSELHVYENGSWISGQSHTFFITGFVPGATYYKMPYIILNHGDYEEEIKAIPDFRNPERLEEWLDDYPVEVFQDVEEDELDKTVVDSAVGEICYRTIIKEIKCERIGEQSFIDRWGRRRSHTIYNHLIQSHANCIIIIDDYLEKFQILKKKVVIDYDIPIPFEREDCILLGIGKHTFKADGEGEVLFKADGEGENSMTIFVLAKIRKIDSNYISGMETILSLELEV